MEFDEFSYLIQYIYGVAGRNKVRIACIVFLFERAEKFLACFEFPYDDDKQPQQPNPSFEILFEFSVN